MIGRLFDRAIAIRNELENGWLDDPVHRSEKETLFDYVIVTQYYGNKGMLTKQQDYGGPAHCRCYSFGSRCPNRAKTIRVEISCAIRRTGGAAESKPASTYTRVTR
jgi:hypothetical protein